MKNLKRFLPPAMVLLACACMESTAPTVGDNSTANPSLQGHLKWERPESLQDLTATMGTPTGEFELIRGETLLEGNVSQPDNYEVSFWAVKGQDRYLKVALEDMPVMLFDVPAQALSTRPDGTTVVSGDSVLITVGIDSVNLAVRMSPAGLQFDPNQPAVLSMWYEAANGDFNGDGVVDKTDWYIETNEIGMWYQQDASDDWSEISSDASSANKLVTAPIYHFSGYAVSW